MKIICERHSDNYNNHGWYTYTSERKRASDTPSPTTSPRRYLAKLPHMFSLTSPVTAYVTPAHSPSSPLSATIHLTAHIDHYHPLYIAHMPAISPLCAWYAYTITNPHQQPYCLLQPMLRLSTLALHPFTPILSMFPYTPHLPTLCLALRSNIQ